MTRLLRWSGVALGSALALGVVAGIAVYVQSERVLQRTYPIPAVALSIPNDTASVSEGRRLATIRGCFHGCHGKDAEGAVLFDQPAIARLVAPNLTAAAHHYSDAQLAAIIRNGVRPDGHGMLVMPSESFVGLTDDDLARIIAFLKSLPAVAGPGPHVSFGPLGRLGLATGQFKPTAQMIAEIVPPPAAASDEARFGRYLALTVCSQCHGTSLRGASNPEFASPDLMVVAAYTPEAFVQLLRTGVAVGGRNAGVMSASARNNLSSLTDEEIAALYSYLHSLPEDPHR